MNLPYNPHLNPMSREEFEKDPNISAMVGRWRAEGTTQPFALGRLRVSLTQKCNYACPFCYNEGSAGVTESLTQEDLEFILDVADPFIRTIKLTGGEPMAHRRFDSIATLCSARRPTSVTTNGSFLDRHMDAVRLMQSVTVSIQSLDLDAYGQLMGTRRSVEQVVSDIATAIRVTGTPFQVNCVVTRETVAGLLPLCRALESIGVSQVNLLGMLKLSEGDVGNYVPYRQVSDEIAGTYGPPLPSSSTRMRFSRASSFAVELVYQYCSVACEVCRTDGFIRIDPELTLSYCLAARPISIRVAVKARDRNGLAEAFSLAVSSMGRPTGDAPEILKPRRRATATVRTDHSLKARS